MSGTDNINQDAATNLIIDTLYRLTQAMVSDTEHALAAGKDVMLERAIRKALEQKNDDSLGLVLSKCYDVDDSVSMELFSSFVERYSMVTSVVSSSGNVMHSHMFAIPVTLARMDNHKQPKVKTGKAFKTLIASVADTLGISNDNVFISDYLYHPVEMHDVAPSDLYSMHQGLVDHAQGRHDKAIVNKVLCRSGWPTESGDYDGLTVELFYLVGSITLPEEVEDPFDNLSDEVRDNWRGDMSEVIEKCLSIKKDEGFAVIGDIDLYYPSLRNGAIDHKEFAFELEVENVIMRDKNPPQALSVLITQFGDDDIVSQVHVSIFSILDNVLRSGFVYGLESFESTDDVIDSMIEMLKDWDITRIQVMDTLLALDHAFDGTNPVFLLPEQTDVIAPVIDIEGRKERLLH